MRKIQLFGALGLMSAWAVASASVHIVAAENFYGDVAQTIGGSDVTVTSIMNNPNQDPHLFNASPAVAIAIAKADIVVENGVGYDAWMDKLYASSNQKAFMLNVGDLMHRAPGDNPHIWYDPATMPLFAKALAAKLTIMDPAHKDDYQRNLAAFLQLGAGYQQQIATLKAQVAGEQITATEPVIGDLAAALGLVMLNSQFQRDVMNGADLSPMEIAQFQQTLVQHQVKLLVYNSQVMDPTTTHLKALALQNNIPVIGVTETMPSGLHYYAWMQTELSAIARALGHAPHD